MSSGRRWSRIIAPTVLIALLGAAAVTVAQAATQEYAAPAPLAAAPYPVESSEHADALEATGPTPDPKAQTPQITVVFPPPPEPEPAAPGRTTGSRSNSGGSSSGGASSGGSSYPLLDSVNAVRAAAGQAPLTWSSTLSNGAGAWSRVMCADHDNAMAGGLSIEQGWETAFRHAAFDGTFRGENIYTAYGASMSLGAAHVAWVNSPGHYANIVRSSFTQYGVASCTSANGVYFATERFS